MQIPARASNHNWLSRLTCAWSSAESAHVQPARRRGPASVSTVPALSSTVCINGIGIAAATPVTDEASGLISQYITGCLPARGAHSAEVVESDHRIRRLQVDAGVQIAQRTVGQAVGQASHLFFGVLDHRSQSGVTGQHLRPVQSARRSTPPGTWW